MRNLPVIEEFEISNNFGILNDEEWTKFYSGIIEVGGKVTQKLHINQFHIQQTEFEDIIKAFKNWKEIKFESWSIKTPDQCEFDGLEEAIIQKISFSGSGGIEYSNWRENSSMFKNIILGLSKFEAVRDNLKEIEIDNCGLPNGNAEEILKRYKFKNVIVNI